MSDNAVAVIEKPHELSVIEVKAQVAKVQTLMHDLMQEGTHYGESFPGDTKKNLLKPGADKLCFMFRLRPDFTQEVKELPNGHMEVMTRCQIFHIESGQKFADGVGLATTMESKYRWRNTARKCPQCGKETIIKGKEEYGGGYICFGKKGGCGAKFGDDDPAITGQVVGKVENPDIADTYNTVIKMSKKRAYVDATITACAASDIFSQDAEDFRDVTEPLVQEAGREESQQKAPTPDDTLRQQCIDGMNELKNIMSSRADDGSFFFSVEEHNVVRAALNLLKEKTNNERWVAISKLLDSQKEQLHVRYENWQKVKRSTAQEPLKKIAGKDNGKEPEEEPRYFEDDIPGEEDRELVAADGELDIF
jgi:predicted RNA-binding Zn-ribbon protein involved in translation (DUF1610 family)